MKELNIFEATGMTSPNPLTLICTEQKDGTTNLAPICFVSYLSFNPPMFGFATGKVSQTGVNARETGKAIVTVPGESLAQAVFSCGGSTGAKVNKPAEFGIEMADVEGSKIKVPADSKLVMMLDVKQTVETGDHILHICDVTRIMGDAGKKGLFAFNGFGKVCPAVEG